MNEQLEAEVAPSIARSSSPALAYGPARLEDLREQARALAESVPPSLRLDYARTFCSAIMSRYWSVLRPRPRQALRSWAGDQKPLKGYALDAAAAIADAAAERDADDASYLVGRVYATMLPEDFRAQNGVYYTPPGVVRQLLDTIEAAGINWGTASVLDPACGGGAFLGPVLRRMVPGLHGSDRRIVMRQLQRRLRGFELDPFSAWMSAVFVDVTLFEELGIAADEDLRLIEVTDSLKHQATSEFDLLIGNPPYGRVKLAPTIRKRFARSLYGHANLYGLFLDLAVELTKPEALIAYVTPTGFLCGEYFKNLRALLAASAPPVALEFISKREGVFDDVLQETLLAVFRKGATANAPEVRFVEVADERVKVTSAGQMGLPPSAELPWIVPRAPATVGLATQMRSMRTRLADWGYAVRTGPLVWNRYKDQLRQRQEPGSVPLIWAEAVGPDGTFAFRAARRNHAPFFMIKEGDDALVVRSSCVLLQRTTSKEQARRLVAAQLPTAFLAEHGAITVENHLNMIVPIVESPPVDTKTLAAFMNSEIADRAFRCISGTVAVSAYELEAMPLPSAWAMKGLTQLLEGPHRRDEINKFCARLYGEK
ncbi:Eco57I restriction-modification methylase domain-containing protein [Archangium violaceum]|uniref:Eco57I restriction-modification methylase domain-containing protein n=1 Tax=Archangium violaceum TaxID=83451 RepID=UPI0036DB392F